MNNFNAAGRAFFVLLFALALAAARPVAASADEAGQPEAAATGTDTGDERPSVEGFAPDEQETATPTTDARSHNQAMCARLDGLMKSGLSYAERGKTAETRAALHCPPAASTTQAAEGSQPNR